MREWPEDWTDSPGASNAEHKCRWKPSVIYPGFDVCLVNPVAHYREQNRDDQPGEQKEAVAR